MIHKNWRSVPTQKGSVASRRSPIHVCIRPMRLCMQASTYTDATCMCECMHACLRICSRTGATSHIPCRLSKYEGQAVICMSATVYLPKSSIHLPAESVWPSHVYVCQRAFIHPWLSFTYPHLPCADQQDICGQAMCKLLCVHLYMHADHSLTCRKYVARSIRFQMLSHLLGPYSITVQASM